MPLRTEVSMRLATEERLPVVAREAHAIVATARGPAILVAEVLEIGLNRSAN